MTTSGRSFDPTGMPALPVGPTVDYSLARRASIVALKRGTLATTDVCDAHPELMRAARNIGEPSQAPCPICSHSTLKRVRYVYGDGLKHNNGRVVYPPEWLKELSGKHDEFTCYAVEVCIDCGWNHLLRADSAGRRFASDGVPSKQRKRG